MAVEMFSVGDAKIEVHIQGTGDSVVLLPGLGVDVSMFEDLVPRLNSAGFQAVAINPRGIGRSTGPMEKLTLHDFASDVSGVIAALGQGPVHVLGAAFGNRIARCLAQQHPKSTKSVILISAGGLVPPAPDIAQLFQKLLMGSESMTADERAAAIHAILFSPTTEVGRAKVRERIWYEAIPSQVYAAQATKLEDWWGGGEASMLVIQGLDDLVAPPENGRNLYERYHPRVTLIEVEGAGHAILTERPKQVADTINDYLLNFLR